MVPKDADDLLLIRKTQYKTMFLLELTPWWDEKARKGELFHALLGASKCYIRVQNKDNLDGEMIDFFVKCQIHCILLKQSWPNVTGTYCSMLPNTKAGSFGTCPLQQKTIQFFYIFLKGY